MSRAFINEWKRATNISTVAAIMGVVFCICFDSWNDLVNALQRGNTAFCNQLLRGKKQQNGCVYCLQGGNVKIPVCCLHEN